MNLITEPSSSPIEDMVDFVPADDGDKAGVGACLNRPAASGEVDRQFVNKHRTGRAAATWAASMLYTLTTLGVAFVTTPLLLRYLGQERMGAYRAASEWIGYLSLIDLGITPALGVLIFRARAKQSATETAGVFRSGLVLLIVVAIVTALPGMIIALCMPRLVPVSTGLRHELMASTMISVALVMSLAFQMSRMLMDAEQRGYWIILASLLQSVIAAVLSVVLASKGFGLVAQSGALLIGTVSGAVLCLIPTWRWYLTKPMQGPRSVTPRSMWRLGWPLALSGLGIRLNVMTDSLVVGYMLGPTAVFHLFVTQRIVSMFGGQINSAVNSSWAALAELRLIGRQEAFEAGIVELTGLVVGVGVTLTGTVAAFNSDFVRLWVGSGYYGGTTLSYLTAATSVICGLTSIYGFSLDSAGETAARVPVSIAGAVSNLLLSLLLIKLMGLPGVILGTIIALLASDTWFSPYQVSRRFGVPGRLILRAILRGVMCGLPWVATAAIFAHIYHPASWIAFLAETAVVGLLSFAYVAAFVLNRHERQKWMARFGDRLPGSVRSIFPVRRTNH